MKKIYISLDMEGIGSMVSPGQMRYRQIDPERREFATNEVNSAVEGLLEGGVTEIVVNDSHPPSLNLIPEKLNPAVQLIRGGLRLKGTLDGIDSSYDGVLLMGLHAKSGDAAGIMNHTWIHSIHDLRVNGESIGEIGINTLYAGEYGVPVLLVEGDQAAAAEAEKLIPGVKTVICKYGLSRYAGRTLHPSIVCKSLFETCKEIALSDPGTKPICSSHPVKLEVDFLNTAEADIASIFPEIIREGGRTVSYNAKNYIDAHHAFMAIAALALTVKDEAPNDLVY